MTPFLGGEIFGGGQGEARRQQALRRGFTGEVQEHRGVGERAGILHSAAEGLGSVVGNANADENNGETRLARAPQSRILRDIAGDAIMRHAAGGEQRQLLPAHQAVHQVDRGDAGLYEILRQLARGRIDRDTVDAHAFAGPTAKCNGSPRKRTRMSRKPRPMVDSSTSTTMSS